MSLILWVLASGLLALVLTGLVRRYAVLDIPNQRSMHVKPVPRGGGIAIVLAFFLGLIALTAMGLITLPLLGALLLGGGAIAGIGLLDDRYQLSAKLRLLVQLLAALFAVFCLGGLKQLTLGHAVLYLYPFGGLLVIPGLMWLTNLYNFMDGIDGLAAQQGVFAATVAGLALLWQHDVGLGLLCLTLAAAISGFWVWNWPPAKIFLGDVGSGFIGFSFGVLALATINAQKLSLTFWFILLAIFILDSTFTLISRACSGKRLTEAHRDHLYQRLVQQGYTHRQVMLGALAMNVIICLPLAVMTLQLPQYEFWYLLALILGGWLLWFNYRHFKR